jgi:hypothetical protein
MEMGATFVHHMENAYLIMIKDAKNVLLCIMFPSMNVRWVHI